jgi:sugar transferase (PEP-CTERM system associated)
MSTSIVSHMNVVKSRTSKSSTFFACIVLACDLLVYPALYLLKFYFSRQQIDLNIFFALDLLIKFFVTLLTVYVFDLYKPQYTVSGLSPLIRSFLSVTIAMCIVFFASYLLPNQQHDLGAVISTVLFYMSFFVWVVLSRYVVSSWAKSKAEITNWVLYIDKLELNSEFIDSFIKNQKRQNLKILLASEESSQQKDKFSKSNKVEFISSWDTLFNSECLEVTGVVLGIKQDLLNRSVIEKLLALRLKGIRVYDVVGFYEKFWFKLPVFHLQQSWIIMARGFNLLNATLGLRLKKVIDKILATTLLVLSSPILLIISILVKISSKGPALFKQIRTGENGKDFKLIKFRTMCQDAEKDGAQWAQQNDPRVTKIGKLLRLTRLDELPQLWNVIMGEMSFIGPRPERPVFNKDLEKQIPFYDLRHLVRPGITGWAQVLYPYGASVQDAKEKLQYDLFYIKNYSLFLDVAIILKTIRVILFGRGR